MRPIHMLIKKNRRLYAAAAGLLLLIAVCAVLHQRRMASNAAAATPLIPATVEVERGDVIQSISAPGQVIDAGGISLQSQFNAEVHEIFVHAGDHVKEGQLLLRLGERRRFENLAAEANIKVLEAEKALYELDDETLLSQALLEIAEAEETLKEARDKRDGLNLERAGEETLELARSDVAVAESALREAELQFDAVATNPEDDLKRQDALKRLKEARLELERAHANLTWYLGTATAEEIREMDARVEVAASCLEQARTIYDLAKEDRHPDLLLAQARLDNARSVLADAQSDLQNLEITAPFDGIVANLKVQVGQSVAEGALLLQLVNPAGLEVEVSVTEEDMPYITVGQPAEIFLDAMPEEDINGRVAYILPQRASNERPLFVVDIQLDEIPDKLFPGMTADASLIIDRRQDCLMLPRSVVRARTDGSADVEVWHNGERQTRSVTVGLRGDTYIEILTGLSEGEQVVAE